MIKQYRSQIDSIDSKIVQLLNHRAIICLKIAEEKKINHLDLNDPQRESEILRQLTSVSDKTIPDTQLIKIFKQIISSCKHMMLEVKNSI